MGEHDSRRVVAKAGFDDLSWVNTRLRQAAAKQFLRFDQPMLGIQVENNEALVFPLGKVQFSRSRTAGGLLNTGFTCSCSPNQRRTSSRATAHFSEGGPSVGFGAKSGPEGATVQLSGLPNPYQLL